MVSLAASADGCLVASSALDSHVRVWNARTHETRVVIATPPGENWHLGFIPDSTQGGGGSSLLAVAAGAAKAVKVYDVSEGTSPRFPNPPPCFISNAPATVRTDYPDCCPYIVQYIVLYIVQYTPNTGLTLFGQNVKRRFLRRRKDHTEVARRRYLVWIFVRIRRHRVLRHGTRG